MDQAEALVTAARFTAQAAETNAIISVLWRRLVMIIRVLASVTLLLSLCLPSLAEERSNQNRGRVGKEDAPQQNKDEPKKGVGANVGQGGQGVSAGNTFSQDNRGNQNSNYQAGSMTINK